MAEPLLDCGAPPADAAPTTRTFFALLAAIILVGALWRTWLAVEMPCLARDGVTWCWLARDLGRDGLAALHKPEFQQHPLFPAAVLSVQRLLRAAGSADTPMTWQRAGQVAAGLSGAALIFVTAFATRRLARELQHAGRPARVAPEWSALAAAAVAALLPLNVALSADVMSDELHLTLYVAALGFLTGARGAAVTLAGGLCAGLAFLTRPEALTLVGAAGLTFAGRLFRGRAFGVDFRAGLSSARRTHVRVRPLGSDSRELNRDGPLALAALWALGFLLCAGPYWLTIGRMTPKLAKEPVEQFTRQPAAPEPTAASSRVNSQEYRNMGSAGLQPARGDCHDAVVGAKSASTRAQPSQAALVREQVNLFQAAGLTAYQTLRAGRVVVVLLALPPLIVLRRGGFREPLLAWVACLAGHFGLCVLLQWRHGYLDPRHALPIVGVLTPLAGITVAYLLAAPGRSRGLRWAGLAAVVGVAGLLAAYSLRVPNRDDAFVVEAAARLISFDPAVGGKVLLGGGSQRRLAFYADCRFQQWAENAPTADERWAALRRQLLESRPAYFAIDVGPARETAGNDALLDRLRASAEFSGVLRPVVEVRNEKGFQLLVLALDQ